MTYPNHPAKVFIFFQLWILATSQYFGFTGGGTLFTLELTSNGSTVERARHQWIDGLFDVVRNSRRNSHLFDGKIIDFIFTYSGMVRA